MSNFDGNITADPDWVDVPQLSAVCKALGGAGGPMNAQAVAIVARLGYLATAIDAINAGSALHTGAGAPANALGENGDLYIDPGAGKLYGPKAAGKWPVAKSLVGPAGAPGAPGGPGPAGPAGPGGGFMNRVIFDTPGMHTFTATTKLIFIEQWGGGEGSEGGGLTRGGASAGYAEKIQAILIGDVVTVNVGAGGTGGIVNSIGTPGGDTTVSGPGFSITAGGGSATNGGSAYGGDVNLVGEGARWGSQMGSSRYPANGSAAPRGGQGGRGNTANKGSTGQQPGGGGGGSDVGFVGAPGGNGLVVIWY